MPNHCINVLILKGELEDIRHFQEKARGAKEKLDINRFIPMPEELRCTTSPNRDEEQAQRLTACYGVPDWYTWTLRE